MRDRLVTMFIINWHSKSLRQLHNLRRRNDSFQAWAVLACFDSLTILASIHTLSQSYAASAACLVRSDRVGGAWWLHYLSDESLAKLWPSLSHLASVDGTSLRLSNRPKSHLECHQVHFMSVFLSPCSPLGRSWPCQYCLKVRRAELRTRFYSISSDKIFACYLGSKNW